MVQYFNGGCMSNFDKDIKAFNEMYKLPSADEPTLEAIKVPLAYQLLNFKDILTEEIKEIDQIVSKCRSGDVIEKAAILTEIADLLGDIQVYCASEMRKYGLTNSEILNIIMQSNMSKMGPDGKAIYDARGKLQKGPNYWKPEPLIQALIEGKLNKGEDNV